MGHELRVKNEYLMKKYAIACVLLLAGLTACKPVRLVSVNRLAHADAEQFETFAFAKLDKRVEINRADGDKIKEILREMGHRGYSYLESSPDLLIDLDVTIQQTQQTRQTNFNEAPGYIGQRRYAWRSEEVPVNSTTTAFIHLTMARAEGQKKVWQGTAKSTLSRKKSSVYLTEAVTLLLDDFIP